MGKNRPYLVPSIVLLILFCLAIHPLSEASAAEDTVVKGGDILQLVIPATALGAAFFLDDREGQKQCVLAFLTNLGLTYGLKYTVNKKRPDSSDHSFPSGHTSAAFQGATFIHLRYGLSYAAFAYLAAVFVAYSRVVSDNHYPEDVVAGAAIGILSSLVFTKPYKGWQVTPTAQKGYYGFCLSRRW
jgi:membrane-associated phospholipid phosphatase